MQNYPVPVDDSSVVGGCRSRAKSLDGSLTCDAGPPPTSCRSAAIPGPTATTRCWAEKMRPKKGSRADPDCTSSPASPVVPRHREAWSGLGVME